MIEEWEDYLATIKPTQQELRMARHFFGELRRIPREAQTAIRDYLIEAGISLSLSYIVYHADELYAKALRKEREDGDKVYHDR